MSTEGAVTVRFWAAARAAAGRAEDTVAAGTLAELVAVLGERHGERLAEVLGYCSFLVDGQPVRDRTIPVAAGSELEVLPPFAGG
jgi:molybdopterin converting factor small subunit